MNDVFIYLIDMPTTVDEVVLPSGPCDFTVYLNARLTRKAQQEAFRHALWHIQNNDFERHGVGEIEAIAHERDKH